MGLDYNQYAGMDWTGGDWGTKAWADAATESYRQYLMGQVPVEMARPHQQKDVDWRDEILKNFKIKKDQLYNFLTKAQAFQTEQSSRRDELLRGFRDYSEAGVGRSLGAINRAAALRNQRSGLGRSGLAGRAAAMSETALRGQGDASQQAFAGQLGGQMAGYQHDFMMGESKYLQQIDLLNKQGEWNMKLAKFQAELQRDAESRDAFYGFASGVGQALPLLFTL